MEAGEREINRHKNGAFMRVRKGGRRYTGSAVGARDVLEGSRNSGMEECTGEYWRILENVVWRRLRLTPENGRRH